MPWQFIKADDIGGRSEQQDRCAVLQSDTQDAALAVVADGVGGHGHGSLAAQRVIDLAAQRFTTAALEDPEQFLEQLCLDAHRAILALEHDGTGASCSTCVFLLLREADAYWAHCGDSRLYLIRDGVPILQTSDHSMVQLQLDAGAKREEITVSANQLYMCLGAGGGIEPVIDACKPRPGDTFLLCSDGFWGPLQIEEVARSLACNRFESPLAEGWVQQAKRTAGSNGDNISLVLARLASPPGGIAARWWRRLLRLLGRERRAGRA